MITLAASPLIGQAQVNMKPIEELINRSEPASVLLNKWITEAKNKIEVLPCDTQKAKDALYNMQVTTRSPMGAIVYTTGGMLIDDGWMRLLGSGSNKLTRLLPEWNRGKSFKEYGEKPGFLLVADDAVGGFFAINGGALGADAGNMYYLAPDELNREPLSTTYSQFLEFCFNGDFDEFYENLRWKGWRADVAGLGGDKVFAFFPYLWSKEGKDN